MTLQNTFQTTFHDAIHKLEEMERDLLEQARQVGERKNILIEVLDFLRNPPERAEGPPEPGRQDGNLSGDTLRMIQSHRQHAGSLEEINPDFQGSANIQQRLESIALAAQSRTLNVREIAQFLIDRKIYRSSKTDIRSRVRRAMQDSPGLYRQTGHETFIYTGPAQETETQPPARENPSRRAQPGLERIMVNLAGAKTLREKLIRLGQDNPGTVLNITRVAELLAKTENLNKPARNMYSTLHRTFNRMNEFESVSPGCFRYRDQLPRSQTGPEPAEPDADSAGPEPDGPEPDGPEPDSLEEIIPDFRGTANLTDNVERVALAAQGKTLDKSQVAQILIHHRMHSPNMASLKIRVQRVMKTNPIQYRQTGPSTFIYIGPDPNRNYELTNRWPKAHLELRQGRRPKEGRNRNLTSMKNVIVDFSGASTLRKRLLRIGETNPGITLNITKAAEFLIEQRQHHGDPRNMIKRISETLQKLDEFEKVSPGNYRHRGTPAETASGGIAARNSSGAPNP